MRTRNGLEVTRFSCRRIEKQSAWEPGMILGGSGLVAINWEKLAWEPGGSSLLSQWPWFSCHMDEMLNTWGSVMCRNSGAWRMFALTGNLETEAWWFAWQLGTGVLRERERISDVIALEARWNLVLKWDCWLTMDCERAGRYRLFGNAGFEFSMHQGSYVFYVELQLRAFCNMWSH